MTEERLRPDTEASVEPPADRALERRTRARTLDFINAIRANLREGRNEAQR